MTTKDEALKLAQDLRTLADRFSDGWHGGIKIDASDIILLTDAAEALAEQPAQRTWVGLTEEEIETLEMLYAPPVHPDFVNDADHCLELIRRVETKLKEKNT